MTPGLDSLVARIAASEPEALIKLYWTIRKCWAIRVWGILRDNALVDDVLSDAFLAVYTGIMAGRLTQAEALWVYTNVIVMRTTSSLSYSRSRLTAKMPVCYSPDQSPEDAIAAQERRDAVNQLLSSASPESRAILASLAAGRRYTETHKALGLSRPVYYRKKNAALQRASVILKTYAPSFEC